jgi:hypothetical protein
VRASALALAAVVLAAGCGGSKSQEHPSGSSPTIKSILERPGPDVQIVPGTSDYAPGPVRFSFLVIRPNGAPVYTPTARVFVARSSDSAPFTTTVARLEPVGVPGSTLDSGDVTHLYVSHFAVPKAGTYLVVAEPIGGAGIQAAGEVDVRQRSASPALGSLAIRSRTPTLASTHGNLSALTTRVPPDRALLRYSVADSLAAHAPFVVTFATPKLCTSRTCGPVVDVVQSVARRFRDSGVRFIHVEVFKDNDPTKGYNRWMREWHLPTEPWTFLVGRDGRIGAKFEGSVSAGELAAAVRRRLAG